MTDMDLDEVADLFEKVHSVERQAQAHLRVITSPEDKETVRAALDDAGYDLLPVFSHPSMRRGEVRILHRPPEPLPAPIPLRRNRPLWKRLVGVN